MTKLFSSKHQSWLFGYGVFLSLTTFLLIIAGGLVTSHEAGLAVPDWPLSYGQIMPPMVGNIFWEHGHRMIAGAVGIFTLSFAVLIQKFESRNWMKSLGWTALGAVVFQALLGGLTVLLMLPAPISIFHACLAQSFFALIVSMTYFLSRQGKEAFLSPKIKNDPLFLRTSVLVFIQLILGATIRHTGHGTVFHVATAFLVVYHIALVVGRLNQAPMQSHLLSKFGIGLGLFTITQFFLGIGAFVFTQQIERGYAPTVQEVFFASAHHSVGALILVSSVLITVIKAGSND